MIPRPRYPLQFLIALLVAFIMWYTLSAQRRESISVLGAQASLTLVNLPRDLVIVSDVPESVALRLRGPRTLVAESRTRIEVMLNLAEAQPGLHSYPIKAEDIGLPPEVSVVSVDPTEITLDLERLGTRRLPVRAVVEGVPAPGFVVSSVRVVPDQMVVRGPGTRLATLDFVETSRVSVEGATTSVEASVQAVLPDPHVRLMAAVPLLVVVTVSAEPTPTPSPTPSRRRR